MSIGTKIRLLGRLLDDSDAPFWAIDANGKLVYLSATVGKWLGRDCEMLLGRRCLAGTAISDDVLDRVAASLSPPPGIVTRGTASLRIQVPTLGDIRVDPMDVRFVQVGRGDTAFTIAIGGTFHDRITDPELKDAVALRERLDAWRKRHASMTTIATAGNSSSAKRLRRRLQVAAATRTDIVFYGPPGCASEAIANRIHQLAAPGEPIVVVDGSLMDPELLDAALATLINQLSDSASAKGTSLVRNLDEMPLDAQNRLAELHSTFGGRLRLLGICSIASRQSLTNESSADKPSRPITEHATDSEFERGLNDKLTEILSTLSVTIDPLSSRVDDVPMLAAALLDSRRAAGEGVAERISRAALDALVIYPWPNNFDELDAAIRHAIRAATSSSIAREQLPLAIRSYRPGMGSEKIDAAKAVNVELDEAVASYERRLIMEAVEAANGNRAEASRRLGISRSRLIRKLDEAPDRDTHSRDTHSRDTP